MAIVGEAHIIVRAITTNVERDIQRSLRGVTGQGSNLGRQFGQAFGSAFSGSNSKNFSKFRREAIAAADGFAQLVRRGYAVGPAVAFVVASLSSLTSGLVALTSQIALATPSLIVLPSLFTAMGQAMLVAKIAFKGVGEALKQTGKSTKAVDRMPSLLEAVRAAENRVTRAKDRATEAENNLNKAREEAKERIEQLRFSAEDAAISEKRAALQLEKARESLARVQDLPPNSRARREAELAYQEADLNYRQAVDRNADLKKELNEVSANGTRTADEEVENSEEVVRAKKEVAEAGNEVTEANRKLALANKAVLDEQKKQKEAAASSPMSKLSEEAQSFVKYLQSLKPLMSDLKDAAGEKLFPQLEKSIGILVKDLYPKLIPLVRDTGDALGYSAIQFSKIITAPEVMKNLQEAAKTNVDTISKLGTVAGNLTGGFLALLAAADPLIRRFTDWVVKLTETWRASMETKKKTGELTDMFNSAGDVAAQLGRVLKNIWDALKNIGKAASGPGSGGEMLLNAFEGATKKFSEFTAKLEASGELEKYFQGVAKNVIEIGKVVADIAKEFLKLGDDENVGKTAKTLGGLAKTIGGALSRLLEGAPALGEFTDKFAKFLALFAESESINNFFKLLSGVMDILLAIFGNETVMKIALFVGANLAFVKALQLVNFFAGLAGKIVYGYISKVDNLITTIGKAPAALNLLYNTTIPNLLSRIGILQTAILKLSYALNIGVGASSLIVVAAIAAVIAIFVAMYMKSEKLREAVSNLINGALDALRDAWYRINEAIKEAIPGVEGVGDVFKTLGDFIGQYIVPIIEVILVGAIGMIVDRIVGFIKIVGGIIDIFRSVLSFIQAFWALFTGDTDTAIQKFKDAFGSLVSGLGKIFGGVADIILSPFRFAFNLIADLWNNTIGELSFTMPDIPGLPGRGRTFSMPKIPKWEKGGAPERPPSSGARAGLVLATGGIVQPTRGGTLATIAEAGRPERVEPLDPDGLSKRDKAMIQFLSGGMNGATFNIYPSPGMDEVELASLVSRQIAFQLRKGAA